MRGGRTGRLWIGALGLAAVMTAPVMAQEGFPPAGWHARRVTVESKGHVSTVVTAPRVVAIQSPIAYRGLTINRRPETNPNAGGYGDDDAADDVMFDGTTRYGDIRSFNPFPTVTSGTQLPYGLDGVGGYGSELGYAAADSAHLYQR